MLIHYTFTVLDIPHYLQHISCKHCDNRLQGGIQLIGGYYIAIFQNKTPQYSDIHLKKIIVQTSEIQSKDIPKRVENVRYNICIRIL
jgi:hypothetical protein